MRKETFRKTKYEFRTHGTNGLNFGNGLIINNNNVYLYVDFLKKMGLERFLIE